MNLRTLFTALACAAALLGVARSTLAEGVPADELRVAFLYNFAKFTEWPDDAWEDRSAPFVVVVHGDASFERVVEDAMRGRTIHGRPVVVRTADGSESAPACHLLYVAATSAPNVVRALTGHDHGPVLTVGEGPEFLKAGGVVGLVEVQGKIQFEINLARARASGLELSSKLLALAKQVHRNERTGG